MAWAAQEDGCWMENDIEITPSRAAAAAESQKALCPNVQPAAVSWMKPQPSSVPLTTPTTPKKAGPGAGSQRSGWENRAARATVAATMQLAKASEAAVRLANMALMQMSGTDAPVHPPLATELCTPAKCGQKPKPVHPLLATELCAPAKRGRKPKPVHPLLACEICAPPELSVTEEGAESLEQKDGEGIVQRKRRTGNNQAGVQSTQDTEVHQGTA